MKLSHELEIKKKNVELETKFIISNFGKNSIN